MKIGKTRKVVTSPERTVKKAEPIKLPQKEPSLPMRVDWGIRVGTADPSKIFTTTGV